VGDHLRGGETVDLRRGDEAGDLAEFAGEALEASRPGTEQFPVLLFGASPEEAFAVIFDAKAVAVEVRLPRRRLVLEDLFRLGLELLLDLVDLDDDRSDAADDARVPAADDEFEKPLDHGKEGRLGREKGILSHFAGFTANFP
jgi:pyruvate/2-oxoacid:ferredoxin oxidoreductase alpha subunit